MMSLLLRTVAMTMTAIAAVIATIKLKVSHPARVKNPRSQLTKAAPLLSHQNHLKRRKGIMPSLAPLMHQNYQRRRKRDQLIREVKRSSAKLRTSIL